MTSALNIADSDADVKIHADIRGGSGCGAPIHLYLRHKFVIYIFNYPFLLMLI